MLSPTAMQWTSISVVRSLLPGRVSGIGLTPRPPHKYFIALETTFPLKRYPSFCEDIDSHVLVLTDLYCKRCSIPLSHHLFVLINVCTGCYL